MNQVRLLLVFLLLASYTFGVSQNSNNAKTITDKYLIKNVFITAQPGQAPSYGAVLIEKGLIKQVGNSIKAPFDAEVIDGDSMYLYAGFIDGLSHTGIAMPDDESGKPDNPGNPPNALAGITPNHSAFDFLSAKESSLKDMRNAGVCISHVVPKGKMLPGQGAIILTNGKSPESLTLKKEVSQFSQLKGSRGMYPATVIGVMAKWRELYRQAAYAKKHHASFKNSPNGIQRPSYDKEIESLFPLLDKKASVFFKAQKALDLQRVLTLQKDLGFPLVLSEVQMVEPALQKIKSSRASVLLSMKLPKEEKKKEDKKEEGKEKKKEKKKSKEKTDPETEALKKRKQEAVNRYVSQAALLEKNNIPFAFSFLDGKSKDILANLRRMIEKGLSEKAALSALTTSPATILGIEKLAGSIEKGKLANLVMTDQKLFEEKTKIKYVFVEGVPFKMEEKKKKKKSSEGEGADIVGRWDYEMEIPMPDNTGIILIEKTEDSYKVSIASVDDLTDFEIIEDVSLDGDNFVFDFDVDNDGFTMNIAMDLNFDGESFEGTITAGQFGEFPMAGKRTSKTPEFK